VEQRKKDGAERFCNHSEYAPFPAAERVHNVLENALEQFTFNCYNNINFVEKWV